MNDVVALLLGWLLCCVFGVSVVAVAIVMETLQRRREEAKAKYIEELVAYERARWAEAERLEAEKK